MNDRIEQAARNLTAMLHTTAMLNEVLMGDGVSVQTRLETHFRAMDAARTTLQDTPEEVEEYTRDMLDMFLVAIEMLLNAVQTESPRDLLEDATPEQKTELIAAARRQIGCCTETLREVAAADPEADDAMMVFTEINDSFEATREIASSGEDVTRQHMLATAVTAATAQVVLARAGVALPGLLEAYGYAKREGYTIRGETAQDICDQIMALVVLDHGHDHSQEA